LCIKAGVLEAVEKGVSPEDFAKQIETIAKSKRQESCPKCD